MKIYEMTFGESGVEGQYSLFTPTNELYITNFQRPYTWEDYQVQGVIQDVQYILETGETVGWPSMLLQINELKDLNKNSYYVGDGQQRSTTVFIFLIAIWHYWKKYYQMTEKAVENDFFSEIFHQGKDRSKGIIGRNIFGKISTVINFQTDKVNEQVFGLLETEEMDDNAYNLLKQKRDKNSESQIYNTFMIFWNELQKADYSEQKLKEVTQALLTKIVFPVSIYENNENMFRAFANINSFGEPLTQSDLVKAELFGRVNTIDKNLSNKIAKFWNENMSPWFSAYKNKNRNFDWFLTEEFNIFNTWSVVATRNKVESSKKQTDKRWLKDKWQSYFDEKAVELKNDEYLLKEFYEDTYEKIKEHFQIYKNIAEEKTFAVGTKEWEAQYTDDIFTSLNLGVIFQLHDEMTDRDFIKTMSLLRRYFFYSCIVLKDFNPAQSLTTFGSPLRKRGKITYEQMEEFLVTQKSTKGKSSWMNKENVLKNLSKNEYPNTFNMTLNKLFVYINNEKLVHNGHKNEQKNTLSIHSESLSREHIMPQTNESFGDDSTIEEQEYYTRKISTLGNVLVISGKENSSIKNNAVKEKIKIYEKSKDTPWGNFWINDFLEDYNKNPENWGSIEKSYEAIENRSKKLAEVIAPYLCNPNKNIVIQGDINNGIKSLEISDNKGNKSSGKKINKIIVDYLQQLAEDDRTYRTMANHSGIGSSFYFDEIESKGIKNKTLIRKNLYIKNGYFSSSKIEDLVNELNSYLHDYEIYLKVENKDVKEENIDSNSKNTSKRYIIITDTLDNTIESKNYRQTYIKWVQKLAETEEYRQSFYAMLEQGSPCFRIEKHQSDHGEIFTHELSENLHLMVNLNIEAIKNRIESISNALNIEAIVYEEEIIDDELQNIEHE